MSDENIKEAIKNVCLSLLEQAEVMRRKSDSYAKMFKSSEYGLRGILDDVNDKMERIILDACQVIKEKTGKEVTNDIYTMLQCLPLCRDFVEHHISETEGFTCCVDKARELFKDWTLKELAK